VDDRGDPTKLSCEVADLLARAKAKKEAADAAPPEQKYRDYEVEHDIDITPELEVEKTLGRNKDLERELSRERKRKKEKTKQQLIEKAKKNPKKALKEQKQQRKHLLKGAQKTSHVEEKNEPSPDSKRRQVSFSQRMRKAMRKMANYSAHSKRAPGNQAGTFDDKVEAGKKKRGLKHDFSFGARTIVEYFTAKIGNLTVKGVVTHKESAGESGETELQQQNVQIQEAVTDRGRVLSGEAELGHLSPDAVLNAVDRGGQGMSR
jgi:hypothetical protein